APVRPGDHIPLPEDAHLLHRRRPSLLVHPPVDLAARAAPKGTGLAATSTPDETRRDDHDAPRAGRSPPRSRLRPSDERRSPILGARRADAHRNPTEPVVASTARRQSRRIYPLIPITTRLSASSSRCVNRCVATRTRRLTSRIWDAPRAPLCAEATFQAGTSEHGQSRPVSGSGQSGERIPVHLVHGSWPA